MLAAPFQVAYDEQQPAAEAVEEPGAPISQREDFDTGDADVPSSSAPSKLRPRQQNGLVAPIAPAQAAPQPAAGPLQASRPDTTGATVRTTDDDDLSSDSISGSVPGMLQAFFIVVSPSG